MAQIPGRFISDGSVPDSKLQPLVSPNKVMASSVEDKFLRNDVDNSISGKLWTLGLDAGFQKITGVPAGTAANDAVNVSQLQGFQMSLIWRAPVDEQALAPSGGEVGNDGWRVLINGVGTGVFASHDNEIATWDDTGASWSYEVPQANWALFDKATDNGYTYDDAGLSWIQFNGAGQIVDGDGLLKTGNTLDVVVSDLVGQGVEDDGANNIRISTSAAGHGLAGGGGAGLSVDASQIAGVGVEDDGSEALRLANQGDGIAGGGGNLLSVRRNIYGGANLAKSIHVSENGVAVKVDSVTIGGNVIDNLEVKDNSITQNKITSSVAGSAISGGNGTPLSVVADPTGGANLSRSINVVNDGISVKIDDDTIEEGASNRLAVKDSSIHFSKLDLATEPGLEDGGSDKTRIKIKAAGGIIRDADGLSVDPSELYALGIDGRISDTVTLTGPDIVSGFFSISKTPSRPTEATLIVIGGGIQSYATDFTVDAGNKRVLMLASLLNLVQSGDKIHVIYSSSQI